MNILRRATLAPGLSRGLTSLSSMRLQGRGPILGAASSARCQASLATQPSAEASRPSFPIEEVSTEPDLPSFRSLSDSISPPTLKALVSKPFNLTTMSSVQAEVLPLLPGLAEPYSAEASGPDAPPRDLLVKAKTGTGKTLAFLIPALEARIKALEAHGKAATLDAGMPGDRKLEAQARKTYAKEHVGTLILSPTRELATQIANEALRLSEHHDGVEVQLLTGGAPRGRQLREWRYGRKDIVVATPGRMRDLLTSEPGFGDALKSAQVLVLDEADTLLDFGFRPDIDFITGHLPPTPQRQTFLFSATVSREIQDIARATLSRNHQFINCVTDDSTPVHAHVEQYHTVLPSPSQQIPHLLRLIAHDQLSNPGKSKTIVFLPTTKMTQMFSGLLRELSRTCLPAGRNTNVYEIHSKRDQRARDSTSRSFRQDVSGASILVTSDVSARGVDYPNVTRVIQVGVPSGTEQYVHRVGRTGRAGTQGRGDLVLLPWEMGFVGFTLGKMPLKPLTSADVTKQLAEAAQKHDEDPKAFFPSAVGGNPRGTFDRKTGRSMAPTPFTQPVLPVVEEIERNITDLISTFEPDVVRETFLSLLGYYIGKTSEMRTTKAKVLEGCKDWTLDACGLETPPFLSDSFLHKMGLSDEVGRRGSKGGRNPFSGQRRTTRDNEKSTWADRGRHGFSREDGGKDREWVKRTRDFDGQAAPSAGRYEPSGATRKWAVQRDGEDDSKMFGRGARRERGGEDDSRPFAPRGPRRERAVHDGSKPFSFRGPRRESNGERGSEREGGWAARPDRSDRRSRRAEIQEEW
ncbi:DEAD-domain-containing protein [Pluteus cervinus]|uniref:DEAD-domain-containing protein n=1 Tax=Pluteus cervinus TaxID=181527 RepID=A0ACD3AFZ5_9AGAR|nr:DEAD-domain-containing protein [Pluteus cervinus]